MQKENEKEFLEVLKSNRLIVKKVCCMYANADADKQDLEQEIILQIWKAFPSFQGNAKMSTWLYKVAINTAITFFKKSKKQTEGNAVCQEFYEFVEVNDDPAINEQLAAMYRAINKLSKLEKALVMLYIEDKSYAEISDILGISEVNARVKLSRTKEKLKELLKDN